MSDAFDPYFKWLGIPKADQPPHAYRLLGIEVFESDADVISNAADGRMAQIKNFQTGKFGAISQKLLNEIAAAKVCLLKPEKKSEYDRRLKAVLQQKTAAQVKPPLHVAQVPKPPVAQAVAAAPDNNAGLSFLDDYATAPTRTTSRTATKTKSSSWLIPTMIGGIAIVLVGSAVGFYIYAGGGDNRPQASLQGDNHQSALPSGSAVPPAKPADSAVAVPKPTGNVAAGARDGGHAPPAPDLETEPKPKPDVVPGPETPNPEEISPKANPDKSIENPVPDQTPNKEAPIAKKTPMPDQEQFQAMKGKVLKIFQKDYSDAKTAPAKLALAAKLNSQGDASKDDPIERFALWRMAADKDVEAGDVASAIDIIEKISAQFEGDTETMKYELLSGGAARATNTPEGARIFCDTAMKLATAAVAREDFDAASRYAKLATGSLRRVKDPQFNRDVMAHDREIEHLKTRYAAVAKAMETLKDDPDSAAANLTVGQWRCFTKGNWDKGLPYLAKGSREDLAQLARQELAKPAAAQAQAAVGDGWWALAEKDRSETKAGFRARALYWYEKASPGLTGLARVGVDKRIETLTQASEQHQTAPAPKVTGPRGVVQKGNVALLSLGATVSGVTYFSEKMLNPADTNPTSYSATPCAFIVTLGQVYQLQQIRFKLQDKTSAAYQVFVSRDGVRFELLQDCSNQRLSGWQNLPFNARPVKCIKLTCNGPETTFCIDSFEAYCYVTSADGMPPGRRGGR
jgi:hypothetical protein